MRKRIKEAVDWTLQILRECIALWNRYGPEKQISGKEIVTLTDVAERMVHQQQVTADAEQVWREEKDKLDVIQTEAQAAARSFINGMTTDLDPQDPLLQELPALSPSTAKKSGTTTGGITSVTSR